MWGKKRQQYAFILMACALAMAALAVASPAGAQENLVRNGGMEGGFTDRFGDGRGTSPNNWEPWFVDSPNTCYDFRPVFAQGKEAYEGSAAALVFNNYQSYTAGFFQNARVGAGKVVRLTAFGRVVSSDEKVGATTSQEGAFVEMKIGIDPTGSGSPFSGSIVWSPVLSATGGYQQFTVEATAQKDEVTVVLYSRPKYCFAENATFFDSVSLVVVGQGSVTSGGGQAAAAQPQNVSIERAPPRADGSIVHIVQSGQYLNLISGVYGVSVQRIQELNNLSGSIIFSGQELLIKPADGAEEATQAAEEAASAEPTSTPPPTTPPQAVAEAGSAPAESVANGNLCVLAYKDANRNATRDPGEALLAGVTVTLSDGAANLGAYTTTGISPNEPYCFMNLEPGTYDLMLSGADLTATTPLNLRLGVPAGQTVRVEHGAVSDSEPASAPAAGVNLSLNLSSADATRVAAASIGAAAVVLFMTVLGVAVYLLFVRPRG